MAAAELMGVRPAEAASASGRSFGQTLLGVYCAVWLVTICAGAAVALAGPTLATPVRELLGLTLTPRRNPPPRVGEVLGLTVHNLPIAAWPLLLGTLGAPRHRVTRRLADSLVLSCILANVLPVGAALGAYGTPLLPYVPQLPLEWAALSLGGSSWLLERARRLRLPEGLALLGVIVCVLLCAAALETAAVPHR